MTALGLRAVAHRGRARHGWRVDQGGVGHDGAHRVAPDERLRADGHATRRDGVAVHRGDPILAAVREKQELLGRTAWRMTDTSRAAIVKLMRSSSLVGME